MRKLYKTMTTKCSGITTLLTLRCQIKKITIH